MCPPCGWRARSGAPPKKEADPARGRHRGGFGAPIPSLADRQGRPLHLRVTGGPRHDRTQARTLGEAGTDAPLPCLLADRAEEGIETSYGLNIEGRIAIVRKRMP